MYSLRESGAILRVSFEIVAQWLEHCPVTAEVAGSSPVSLVSMFCAVSLEESGAFFKRKDKDRDRKVYLVLLKYLLDK